MHVVLPGGDQHTSEDPSIPTLQHLPRPPAPISAHHRNIIAP